MNIFAKIIRKEISADIVYEDDEILAFKDIHPVAPVHILIIPKKNIESIATLESEDALLIGKIHLVARKLAEEYGVAKTGYRIVTNSGDDSGREVPHLHFHLIGGKKLGSKIVTE
jgi:histidine triad (HIT) family protein